MAKKIKKKRAVRILELLSGAKKNSFYHHELINLNDYGSTTKEVIEGVLNQDNSVLFNSIGRFENYNDLTLISYGHTTLGSRCLSSLILYGKDKLAIAGGYSDD